MKNRGKKRQVQGKVISNKMDKTIIVMTERLVKHKLYHKYIKRRSMFTAHDENNDCRTGDMVRISESRPISRTKKWRLSQIIEKAV